MANQGADNRGSTVHKNSFLLRTVVPNLGSIESGGSASQFQGFGGSLHSYDS